MIVISIILALMGMVVVGYPVVMESVNTARTKAALQVLDQAITRYFNDHDICPPDSEVAEGGVSNEVFMEAMEGYGITEEKMKDGWNNWIVYDRLWDEEGEWELSIELPNDPRDEKWFEMEEEDQDEVRVKFFLWSRGKDPSSEQKPPKELLLQH